MATAVEDVDVDYDFTPFFIKYKSGTVKRLMGTAITPPTDPDPLTGVVSKDVLITPDSTVSARLYLPANVFPDSDQRFPIVVYFHGGAFCIETSSSPFYHRYLNTLVSRSNIIVVSVTYRLAPEHPLPAAYTDSWTALQWTLASNSDPWIESHGDLNRLFLAGDNAGANICQWVGMKAGEDKKVRIEGIVLVHAYFWGKDPIGDESTEAWFRTKMERDWCYISPESEKSGKGVDHPSINPTAEDAPCLKGLGCRKVIVCVTDDLFKHRNLLYYQKLKASGWDGEVELVTTEGERHVFHLLDPTCDKAVQKMDRLVHFFNSS